MVEFAPMSDQRTPLYHLFAERGAGFVSFADYTLAMKIKGIKAEHLHTREAASIFDVSHMGQVKISGRSAPDFLSHLLPIDAPGLSTGCSVYTQLLNHRGGILDDLIIGNDGDFYFIVFNGSRKHEAVDWCQSVADAYPDVAIEPLFHRALVSCNGPRAPDALITLYPECSGLSFMQARWFGDVRISRTGYTGEDGFEISVEPEDAEALVEKLLTHPFVECAGLGARDSLRLEAGLCLYGNELSEATSPVEAGLAWSIPKHRRVPNTFIGSDAICDQLANGINGISRRLVGLLPQGKVPIREHTPLVDADGKPVGEVTSGLFSPSLNKPIAMGYVDTATKEADVYATVRGKTFPLARTKIPFVPTRYKKH